MSEQEEWKGLPLVNYAQKMYASEPLPARCMFSETFLYEWTNNDRLVVSRDGEYLSVKMENGYGTYRRDYRVSRGSGMAFYRLCEASWRRPPPGVLDQCGQEDFKLDLT